MAKLYVKYNPYRLQTEIKINGNAIEKDSRLYKYVKDKRLQEWVGEFPEELRKAVNTVDFDIKFHGMEMDWDDFEDAFRQAVERGVIKPPTMEFVAGKSQKNIVEKLTKIFDDLRDDNAPVEAFKDEALKKSFDNVKNAVFPINVIATMSSGKSTLINALLSRKMMPSKNEACTATVTRITDNDRDDFQGIAYDRDGNIISKIDNIAYANMVELNEDPKVQEIAISGNIPFIDANTTALRLVDTPGPNNSQNQDHKNTTYRAVESDANNLILYVLNGTQLATNDDDHLLNHVAEKIRTGGKLMRDRFLFAINRMDDFNPEEENIESAIEKARTYLVNHGIENPQIFPCSAYVALNIRTYLRDIDPAKLKLDDMDNLPDAALDTISKMRRFRKHESMHLEAYSNLSPIAKRELNAELAAALDRKDSKGQVLIHCGIRSIESAIIAYVKKYAMTKKIKDLVETFQGVLEASEVLAKVKATVATDENALREITERAKIIQARIDDGKEAQKFKDKINAFNPMESIREKTEELTDKINEDVSNIFQSYDEFIESKREAVRLVNQFTDMSSNTMAKLAAELETIINRELVETGERLLREYQEKLTRFDKEAQVGALDFDTASLVKDGLTNLRESINTWRSDSFAMEKAEAIGETTIEVETYHEKVGTEKEDVIVGSHDVEVGTRQVKSGSHIEPRTRRVKNPDKQGWKFLMFWRDDYVDETYYVNVDDYRTEKVYKTVLDYETVERDVFEERTRTTEKFRVATDKIQADLLAKYQQKLGESIKKSLDYAEMQIDDMKEQFSKSFDELDRRIGEKYKEIEACTVDQETREKELEKNKKIIKWIEANIAELNGILDV